MKNKVILISSLLLVISACNSNSAENSTSKNSITSSATEEKLSPEEAELRAKEVAAGNYTIFTDAVHSGDASVCESIESNDLQFSCRQNVIFKSAITKNDKSICAQLETAKGKEDCIASFESI